LLLFADLPILGALLLLGALLPLGIAVLDIVEGAKLGFSEDHAALGRADGMDDGATLGNEEGTLEGKVLGAPDGV